MKHLMLLLLCLPAVSLAQEPVDAEMLALIEAFEGQAKQGKRNVPRINDTLFMRRTYLDLTGRLPSPEAVEGFINSQTPNKRALLIDSLMASEAFTDRRTTFFEDIFQMRRVIQNGMWRNAFHDQVRNMIATNTPWDQMARAVLTGQGLNSNDDAAFLFWAYEIFDENLRQDVLDDQVDFVTRSMLGVRTECISCHDGAYHLEEVNKGLSVMTRRQFWGMSAFLSSTYYKFHGVYDESQEDDENYFVSRLGLADIDDPAYTDHYLSGFLFYDEYLQGEADGEYHATTEASEGMRPPRTGGMIEPAYLFTGEKPQPGETRRQALARMITNDRQFARNMVNRIWAHFFGEGFVEPVDGWDLGRVSKSAAAEMGAEEQPRDAGLMEYLTDTFIGSGYDLRALIRHIVNTDIYQWDFVGETDGVTARPLWYWMGDHRVRRLEAEAIIDGINDALQLPRRYAVSGIYDRTFSSTWQLPGTDEPEIGALLTSNFDAFVVHPTALGYGSEDTYYFFQYATYEVLQQLGRGNAAAVKARDNQTSIANALTQLNSYEANWWLDFWEASPVIVQLADQLEDNQISREEAARQLVQRFLYREPTQLELARLSNHLNSDEEEPTGLLIDIAWVLANHPDFLYNR